MRKYFICLLTSIFLLSTAFADLKVTAFDKKIDLETWLQKMNMPIEKLVTDLKNNIDIFRFETSNPIIKSVHQVIQNLSLAPDYLINYNKKNIFLFNAIGIYMPIEQYKYLIQKPTLLLRKDSDHWTVMHEYTHHLFHEARLIEKNYLPENFLDTYRDHAETLQESYEKFNKNNKKFKNKEHLEEFMLCFRVATDFRLKMLLQFEIEEVVIESMMRDFYLPFKNQNFDQDSFENAARYITSNLKRIENTLVGIVEIAGIIIESIPDQKAEITELTSYQMKAQKLLDQIKKYNFASIQ